jgi:STIP1 homology and U-box containing protein 1
LKMGLWDSVIDDCSECLRLSPDNMKAHYYLSQAHLPLHDYEDALQHALEAHDLCVQTGDKSLGSVTAQVLRCKKERWDDMERRRKRESAELETEMVVMMERERDEVLRDSTDLSEGDKQEIGAEWAHKIDKMRQIFDKARSEDEKRRKVPDWAIDDISFGIMIDPVIVRCDPAFPWILGDTLG